MKKLTITIATILSLFISTQALAFITVIDVEESSGKITTIQSAEDYSIGEMEGKYLSYRGQASEAIDLFTAIVNNDVPLAIIESEIDESGNIFITVAINGFAGFEYYDFELEKN